MGSEAILRSETTGPPFWLSPVWSSPRTCRPSSMAAVPRIWFMVTTPVPPMPIMWTAKPSLGTFSVGSGSSASSGVIRRSRLGAGAAPSTVRNEGQSPSRHE